MALPVLHHTMHEVQLEAFTPSIGASPQVAEMRAPYRGRIIKVACVTGGTITTSNATITVAINGTTVLGANIVVVVAGASAGQVFTAQPSAGSASAATPANGFVNEDDVISFTPSNASGANISAQMTAMLRKG